MKAPLRFERMFQSLNHPNYRLFFVGQGLSLPGNSMQILAEAWLTYRVTGSPLALGAVSFVALLPVVPISLFGSSLIDRVQTRKLLIVTQLALALSALAWGALAWSGSAQIWHLILLSFFEGAIASIDLPARQAFLKEMVGRDDLPNTIALNQFLTNAARIVGPTVAGLVIAGAGEAACFLVNALSFVPLIICLASMRNLYRSELESQELRQSGIIQGIKYVVRTPILRWLLALAAVSNLLLLAYTPLMPAITSRLWGAGPEGLGLVMTSVSVGAMLGSLWLANLDGQRLHRWLVITLYALPMTIFAFVGAPSLILALVFAVSVGVGTSFMQTLFMTLVQMNVRDEMRGRTISLQLMLQVGATKVGAMQVGLLGEFVGVPSALRLAALVGILGTTIALRLRPPIEELRGVVAPGLPVVD